MVTFLHKWAKSIFLSLLLLILLILLVGYAAAGWHSRYLADDYCYDAQFIQHGFWQGQINSYLNLMPYSSNRYSLTLFSGLAWALGGVQMMPIIPGAAILLWGLALFYSIQQGLKSIVRKPSSLAIAFISAAILFYTLMLAPNRYQVLFWRSGMLPYLAPLVFNTILVGRLFFYFHRKHLGKLGCLELGLLAWIAAGFSETVFALQASFWVLIFLLMLRYRQETGWKAVLVILLGTFVGAVLLIFNPTNAARQSAFSPPPPLWTLASTSILFAKDFFITFIRSTPLPLFALMGMGFLFGWLDFPEKLFSWRRALTILAGLCVGIVLLLVCIMAPTMWSMSAYPENRGLLAGDYLINLFFCAVGVWAGAVSFPLLQKYLPSGLKLTVSFLLILVLGVYSIRFIPATYALIAPYEKRSQVWDARNAQILQSRANGQTQFVVGGIDSISMIFELQPNENHWVNLCSAKYYRIEQIKTTE